jgi:magnesium and cobalt transporter
MNMTFDESEDAIIPEGDGRYRVKALTEIPQFNETFATRLADDEFDTVGGLVTDQFGRVPKRGEAVEIDDMRFEVLRADARQAHIFLVNRVPKTLAREFMDDEVGSERSEQRHIA